MGKFYTYRHGLVRHIGLRGIGELVLIRRSAYGKATHGGIGLCSARTGRNRWVFFGGPGLIGFVGW